MIEDDAGWSPLMKEGFLESFRLGFRCMWRDVRWMEKKMKNWEILRHLFSLTTELVVDSMTGSNQK